MMREPEPRGAGPCALDPCLSPERTSARRYLRLRAFMRHAGVSAIRRSTSHADLAAALRDVPQNTGHHLYAAVEPMVVTWPTTRGSRSGSGFIAVESQLIGNVTSAMSRRPRLSMSVGNNVREPAGNHADKASQFKRNETTSHHRWPRQSPAPPYLRTGRSPTRFDSWIASARSRALASRSRVASSDT